MKTVTFEACHANIPHVAEFHLSYLGIATSNNMQEKAVRKDDTIEVKAPTEKQDNRCSALSIGIRMCIVALLVAVSIVVASSSPSAFFLPRTCELGA